MELRRQVCRRLHEEHVSVLDLLNRFGQALGRLKGSPPPGDPAWQSMLAQLSTALLYEVTRHFGFEEDELFPRLHQSGQGELAELLFEEHETIRDVVRPLLVLIDRGRTGDLDNTGWQSLKITGLELVERLTSHAEKEELSLVPVLEDLLDEDTDRELWSAYAGG